MAFLDHPFVLFFIGLLSLPVYGTLAKMFWGEDFETLGETVRYLLTPDICSLFRGRYWDDQYATIKFNVYLLLCAGWAAAITEFLARYVL